MRPNAWVCVSVLAAAAGAAGAPWTPPLGVPVPGFGIVDVAPAAPQPWTVPVPGFYYVDSEQAAATDEGNPYGTPALPRRTIPLLLPAGAVVEMHGTYAQGHTTPYWIEARGTAAQPVFIRGVDAAARPRVVAPWEIRGSYFVVENLKFEDISGYHGIFAFIAPADHAALRRCEIQGTPQGGGAGIGGGTKQPLRHVVFYANEIHDNGDWQATFDQDIHGIAVGPRVSYLWIVDNYFYRNSGDGVQINADIAGSASTHHIYVARNVAHHNKQNGLWSKQASDVIFSENLSYAHRPSDSSFGTGMGFQYGPERLWFIGNHIHDCDFGIGSGSDETASTSRETYVIGNVIHDIHGAGFNPGSAWSGAAVMLAGGVRRFVLNNTFHDVDAGVNVPTPGQVVIANNIVSGVTDAASAHVFLELPPAARQSSLLYTLLAGPPRLKWGDSIAFTLDQLRAAFPSQGRGCASAEAGFVDPLAEDFRLRDDSPAIDAGMMQAAYARFLQLYSFGIARDIAGAPRPSGRAIDMGALEHLAPGILWIDDVAAFEGGRGGGTEAVFTVRLSAPAAAPVRVRYATANGGAMARVDYEAASGVLEFAPGEQAHTIVVRIKGDAAVEGHETFWVNLSAPEGAVLGKPRGYGRILNDD